MIAHRLYVRKKTYLLSLTIPIFTLLLSFVICGDLSVSARVSAQAAPDTSADFKRQVESLSSARLGGGSEDRAQLEKALGYLDSIAISAVNSTATPDLDATNRSLAAISSQGSPVGENYRLVKIGGSPGVYAMVVNFGLGGPAAVRIYAGEPGSYKLAAQIDHYAQKDFLDSDIELVSVAPANLVFVTVSGRTDDLSTGAFSAWQFDGHVVKNLWNSDLFQQSSYEVEGSALRIAYCSQVDDDRPSVCLKMSRDVFRFDAGKWSRTETADLPPAKPSAK